VAEVAQLKFTNPDFMSGTSTQEIHERMMKNLPPDIDDMPGGFPYDFTRPAAIEKAELINFHLTRTLMIAFPQYAWDEWLDLHGQQVHLTRHPAEHAAGFVTVTGKEGTEIAAGTVFCTPATATGPALEYTADEDRTIDSSGNCTVAITAVTAGTVSNVAANTICIMAKPDKNITSVVNAEPITGGSEREGNDDFYDRIAAEYANSMTYLGNDADYVRWAKEAGAGDCIVVSAADGPGTVKLVLVDQNGQPANQALINAVYKHIVSPDDRTARLLPTACAKLTCAAATTVQITYACTGLIIDETTDIEQIKADFKKAVLTVYDKAKTDGILRYNDVRPLISAITGLKDFETFTINGGTENIILAQDEYPQTGTLNFSLAE
jgi:uncharacterized phage protein gp47/JayE